MQDLGECEVKHGLRLHSSTCAKTVSVTNVAGQTARSGPLETGRPQQCPADQGVAWPKFALGAALFLSLGAILLSFSIFFKQPPPPPPPDEGEPPVSKSIAVLPFKSLGNEGHNLHLADGVQDEILTDLARVADLKVISRTSVMQYKSGAERNLRVIGKQLGVAHVVEGSVQIFGNRVRVIAQLIDARTDTHIWADRYEGDLVDVFALESEVAEKTLRS